MQVSKEELLHIADLAELNLEEDELENYLKIGSNEAKNRFRKDEVDAFEDNDLLLQNAPSKQHNMFKIPKVL